MRRMRGDDRQPEAIAIGVVIGSFFKDSDPLARGTRPSRPETVLPQGVPALTILEQR